MDTVACAVLDTAAYKRQSAGVTAIAEESCVGSFVNAASTITAISQ